MNLSEETSHSCPFCGGVDDSRIIEKSALSSVFLCDPSMTPGHMLVVPSRHVWKSWDLTEDELLDAFRLINKYRQKLDSIIGPGSDIRQRYRPFVPDGPVHNIRHLHFHIIPRQAFDEMHKVESELAIAKPLIASDAMSLIERLK